MSVGGGNQDISKRQPGAASTAGTDLGEPVTVRLFRRGAGMLLAAAVFCIVVGVLSLVVAFLLLAYPRNGANASGAAAFLAVCGGLILAFFSFVVYRWTAIRSRRPRWVIDHDRLVFVENDAEEWAEIPYDDVIDFELVRLAGAWHVEIRLLSSLDWTAHLPKYAFPVVRLIPGREWAFLIHTTREKPIFVLEALRSRLKAYRARQRQEW